MNSICRKLYFSLVLSLLLVSLCSSADFRGRRDDDDDDYEGLKLSDGAIAAIVITVLIIFFGIPILLCFCCAWCCFRGFRRRKAVPGNVVTVAAPTPQYIPQQYQTSNPGGHQIFIHTQGPYDQNNQGNNGNLYAVGGGGMPNSNVTTNTFSGETANTNNFAANEMSHIYDRPPPYYEATNFTSEPPPKAPVSNTMNS